ncbi:MAG: HEAT repeat domain-containing protein [Planctomycetes bacterium]|nr:HEAT repeat domain-containing protein [Planctomycetota bacterium]
MTVPGPDAAPGPAPVVRRRGLARALAGVLGACVLGGCSPEAPPAGSGASQHPSAPQVPPLAVAPAMPRLLQMVDAAPSGPSEERRAELKDLLEAAFVPGLAAARTQALAQRSLAEDADALSAFELGLVHENPTVRAQCAWHLGQRGGPADLPLLLKRLRYESDRVTKCWVVGALHDLGNYGGLDDLLELMAAPDSSATAYELGGRILSELGRHPGEQLTYAGARLLIDRIAREWHRDGYVLRPAATGDASSDGQAAADPQPPREPALDELDPRLCARAARMLADMQGFQLRPVDDARFVLSRMGVLALPFLRIALRAEEDYLHAHALEVLIHLGRPGRPLTELVLPYLGLQPTESVAMRALGEIGAEQALPYLLAMLADDSIERRASAAGALGPLGLPAAIAPLRDRLQDPAEQVDVRVQAAWSLALLDPGVRFLRDALRDPSGVYHEPTLHELLDDVAHRVPR